MLPLYLQCFLAEKRSEANVAKLSHLLSTGSGYWGV